MDNIRGELVAYYQKIFLQHMAAGTSGNISYCDRASSTIWISPSSVDPFMMEAEDIVVIDFEGNKLEPSVHNPSSEWRMHAAIYRTDPSVSAIVHTHSPYATAFAIMNEPIPNLLVEMNAFTDGEIPVSPMAAQGSEVLAQNVAATLKGRHTCLMERHGAVATGESIPQAFIRAAYIEDAAKIIGIMRSISGKTVR